MVELLVCNQGMTVQLCHSPLKTYGDVGVAG